MGITTALPTTPTISKLSCVSTHSLTRRRAVAIDRWSETLTSNLATWRRHRIIASLNLNCDCERIFVIVVYTVLLSGGWVNSYHPGSLPICPPCEGLNDRVLALRSTSRLRTQPIILSSSKLKACCTIDLGQSCLNYRTLIDIVRICSIRVKVL